MRKKTPRSKRSDGTLNIYGLHAATAALQNADRTILRVTATRNAANRLADPLAARNISPVQAEPRDLDRLLGSEAVHQGIAVTVLPLPRIDLSDLIGGEGTLLALDQVTDPRNIGAILRIAAAFSVCGLVVTRRSWPGETAVLAKAASGGLEHVRICETANLARALEAMNNNGFTVVGLDSAGDTALSELDRSPKTALVLGAEGAGLRRLSRVHCSHIARLDLPGPIYSINVATAAALALQALQGPKASPN